MIELSHFWLVWIASFLIALAGFTIGLAIYEWLAWSRGHRQ